MKKKIVKKNNNISQKNLVVELYKIKFDRLKPFSQALHDYQVNGLVNVATSYAAGLSNGFDVAIDCCLDVLDNINNK